MQVISSMIVGLIDFYQRRISPYKGYQCAHRIHHDGLSCSEYAKQTIVVSGIAAAFPLIRSRFIDCRHAYGVIKLQRRQLLTAEEKDKPSPLAKQGDTCVNVCTLPCL